MFRHNVQRVERTCTKQKCNGSMRHRELRQVRLPFARSSNPRHRETCINGFIAPPTVFALQCKSLRDSLDTFCNDSQLVVVFTKHHLVTLRKCQTLVANVQQQLAHIQANCGIACKQCQHCTHIHSSVNDCMRQVTAPLLRYSRLDSNLQHLH